MRASSSNKGETIKELLTLPVGAAGRRYPLLLIMHGQNRPARTRHHHHGARTVPGTHLSQPLAALRARPAGSSGYDQFHHANYDWGGGDFHDLMTARPGHRIGVTDTDRMRVFAGAIGGCMTSWTITTNRFKAASVSTGMTNLMTFTGTATSQRFYPTTSAASLG